MDEQIQNSQVDNEATTVKIPAIQLTAENELEYAQDRYDKALSKMVSEPTEANIAAFGQANRFLVETQDKYRIGARLMLQHSRDHHLLDQKHTKTK